nr:chymotrypsin inhibitor [Drosophila bipectinata]
MRTSALALLSIIGVLLKVNALKECPLNEIYGCKHCFEPSCHHLLFNDEPCDMTCVMGCRCKFGFVRNNGDCVTMDKCDFGD